MVWCTRSDGRTARQIQVDARCAALGSILKALAMSTIAQRISQDAAPGYWAVAIRLDEASGTGRRYLCHAENNRMAFGMAVRLAGTTPGLRGFNYTWIEEHRLEPIDPALPMGVSAEVLDAREWDRLMQAHQESETALAERQAHEPT